jgi:hypothetical protein
MPRLRGAARARNAARLTPNPGGEQGDGGPDIHAALHMALTYHEHTVARRAGCVNLIEGGCRDRYPFRQNCEHVLMRELTAIDLFSGCGGLTLGLKQAGFRVLAAIEIERTAFETYKKNHQEVLIKKQNIRRVTAYKLMNELGLIPES